MPVMSLRISSNLSACHHLQHSSLRCSRKQCFCSSSTPKLIEKLDFSFQLAFFLISKPAGRFETRWWPSSRPFSHFSSHIPFPHLPMLRPSIDPVRSPRAESHSRSSMKRLLPSPRKASAAPTNPPFRPPEPRGWPSATDNAANKPEATTLPTL